MDLPLVEYEDEITVITLYPQDASTTMLLDMSASLTSESLGTVCISVVSTVIETVHVIIAQPR